MKPSRSLFVEGLTECCRFESVVSRQHFGALEPSKCSLKATLWWRLRQKCSLEATLSSKASVSLAAAEASEEETLAQFVQAIFGRSAPEDGVTHRRSPFIRQMPTHLPPLIFSACALLWERTRSRGSVCRAKQ